MELFFLLGRRHAVETYPKKDFRYGLTFNALFFTFNPAFEDTALQLGISLQNFTSIPIKYSIEIFEVTIESRIRLSEKIPSIFMPRGAVRSFNGESFKLSHLREFFGRKEDGRVRFEIAYGDVDSVKFARRLKMELPFVFSFPPEETVNIAKMNAATPPWIGFSYRIASESDEAIY